MSIDLQAKKTEEEWQQFNNRVIPSATKLWFDWVEWVLIMGALWYLMGKTKSWAVGIAVVISFVMFTAYFNSYILNQISFYNFPFVKSEKVTRWLSLSLAVAISFGISLLLRAVIFEVAAHKE
jgi:hypothetical protein